MCGIIGIVGKSEVASALYDGLTVLQHRGQDAAGIATVDGSRLRLHKARGLVRDVFQRDDMDPTATFQRLVRERVRGGLKGPFNDSARLAAGFSMEELSQLKAQAA